MMRIANKAEQSLEIRRLACSGRLSNAFTSLSSLRHWQDWSTSNHRANAAGLDDVHAAALGHSDVDGEAVA